MKIYGDEASTQFRTYVQEPGIIYGHNDVLVGDRQTNRRITSSFLGATDEWVTTQSKLYLHIFNSFWSSFTGALREYFLPWRWKAAYLDQENGTRPQRILVCTSVHGRELSDHLNALIGQSLFITNLMIANQYVEIFGQEYLRIYSQNGLHENRIVSPLGEWVGLHIEINSQYDLCHIHRIRGIFSLLKYHFLKNLSTEWEEVAIQAGLVSENVLIKRNNRTNISKMGLLV